MEHRDYNGSNGQKRGHHVDAFEQVAQDIRTPLSVVYGHVQLLQRRLRQGRILDPDEILRSLNHIEGGARAIEKHLRILTGSLHRDI